MEKHKKTAFSLDRLKEPNAVFNSALKFRLVPKLHSALEQQPDSVPLEQIIKTILDNSDLGSSTIPNLAAHLHELTKNISDALLIIDTEGNIIYKNHDRDDFWQWIVSDGRNYPVIRNSEGAVIPKDAWPFNRLKRGEIFDDTELSIEGRDGSVFFVGIFKTRSLTNVLGKPVFFMLLVHDITHCRKIFLEQHDLIRKLVAIFNNIYEGLIICDRQGNIIEMNAKAMELHGLSVMGDQKEDNTLSLPELIFFNEEHQVLEEEYFPLARILHEERFNNLELIVRDQKTGREWVGCFNGTPIYDDSGKFVLGLLTVRDITRQNILTAKLRRNDEILHLALTAGKMFIFEWDLVNKKVSRSKEGNNLLGLTKSMHEEPGAFLNNIHPEDQEACRKIIGTLNPLEYDYTQTLRFVRPDNRELIWLEERGQGFFDERGKLVKIVGISVDVTEQKVKEERIKCRERHVHEKLAELEEIYSSAQIGLCVLDKDLNYLRVNKYLAQENGLPVEAHIGKNVSQIVPAFAEQSFKIAQQIFSSGNPVLNVEFAGSTQAHPDDFRYWVEDWLPFKDVRGNITGFNVVVKDVTNQKLFQAKLEKDSVILKHMSEGVSMTNMNGFIQYTNPAFEEMFGYEPGELIGKHIATLNSYSPKRNMEIIHEMMAELERSAHWEGDFTNRRKNGTEFTTRVRVASLTINKEKFFISVQEDVTQFRKLQFLIEEGKRELEQQVRQRTKELRQTNEVLEKFFSASGLMIAYLDTSFNFIRVNEAYAAIIHATPDFFIAKNFFEIFSDEGSRTIFEQTVNTGKVHMAFSQPFSCSNRPELGLTYLDMTLQPVKNAAGAIEALILILINVTERKKMELELAEAQRKLNDAKRLSDIGTLASTVAHELRNPLAAINMAMINIKRKTGNPEIISNQIRTIERKTAESEQIINNLLFYSRIKQPHREVMDLMMILHECLELVKKQHQKNVAVEIHQISSGPVSISADPTQMKEVFCNVLNNAFDAVSEGTGKIDIHINQQNDTIFIRIVDNGSGIDPAHLKRVTEPFFTTKAKGTGLGLSVSTQILNIHNGHINIESRLGEGTAVTINLPVNI
ncbi:MAG: PAS domain S-box protein [Candidatus Omnitrophota bacterium]